MPDFQPNGEAKSIAEAIIPDYHQHLVGVNIAHLIKLRKPPKNEKPPRQGKKVTLAKTCKVPDKMRMLMPVPYYFIIEYDQVYWNRLTNEEKSALVDHELAHCGNDADGVYLKPHSVEEFDEIVSRWGLWKSDLKHFAETAAPFVDDNTTPVAAAVPFSSEPEGCAVDMEDE